MRETIMLEKRNLFRLQIAAKLRRADTEGQLKLRDALKAAGYNDSTILIELERKFFLSRKDSTQILLTSA